MNNISPYINHFIDGVYRSFNREELGQLVARNIRFIKDIPNYLQQNSKVVTLISTNAAFFFALRYLMSRLDEKLSKGTKPLNVEKRVIKHLLLDGIILGGGIATLNVVLSKVLKYTLSKNVIATIALTGIVGHAFLKLLGKCFAKNKCEIKKTEVEKTKLTVDPLDVKSEDLSKKKENNDLSKQDSNFKDLNLKEEEDITLEEDQSLSSPNNDPVKNEMGENVLSDEEDSVFEENLNIDNNDDKQNEIDDKAKEKLLKKSLAEEARCIFKKIKLRKLMKGNQENSLPNSGVIVEKQTSILKDSNGEEGVNVPVESGSMNESYFGSKKEQSLIVYKRDPSNLNELNIKFDFKDSEFINSLIKSIEASEKKLFFPIPRSFLSPSQTSKTTKDRVVSKNSQLSLPLEGSYNVLYGNGLGMHDVVKKLWSSSPLPTNFKKPSSS